MIDPKTASRLWVERALESEGVANAQILAPELLALAERDHVPVELLVEWCHERARQVRAKEQEQYVRTRPHRPRTRQDGAELGLSDLRQARRRRSAK